MLRNPGILRIFLCITSRIYRWLKFYYRCCLILCRTKSIISILIQAILISLLLLDSIGRKKTLIISFGIFAIFSFTLNVCNMRKLIAASFIICRCSIQVAIQTSFVYVAEVSRSKFIEKLKYLFQIFSPFMFSTIQLILEL